MEYLSITSFMHFLIWFLFELKLILLIWKSNNHNVFRQGTEAVRKALISFYIKFYIVTLILLIGMDYIIYNSVFLILFWGLMWVPQIYKNIVNQRKKICLRYVYSMTAIQTMYPLYLKGCPENIFELEYDLKFTFIFISVVFLQLLVINLQRRFGSNFFIPSAFRSSNALIVVKEQVIGYHRSQECWIWMMPLFSPHDLENTSNNHSGNNSFYYYWCIILKFDFAKLMILNENLTQL